MLYERIKFQEKSLPWRQKGIRLMEGSLPGFEGLVVGVDPGVNFGLTIINLEYVQVFNGKLPSQSEPGKHGIDAYNLVKEIFNWQSDFHHPAVVEGAAYNRMFKQVELEETRFGFFLALYDSGFEARIVPPASIRLKAFGHGRSQAGEIWPFLNQNAADSVGCALAAMETIHVK